MESWFVISTGNVQWIRSWKQFFLITMDRISMNHILHTDFYALDLLKKKARQIY